MCLTISNIGHWMDESLENLSHTAKKDATNHLSQLHTVDRALIGHHALHVAETIQKSWMLEQQS